MSEIIRVKNIQVLKQKKRLLAIDELVLEKGKTISVIGPNGAGKSTLLQVLALLMPPSAGEIYYLGELVTKRNMLRFRRQTAVVFQEPLLLNTTVFHNVAQGLRFRGLSGPEVKERVEYWLERLGVAHLTGRTNRYLSGGEAQRVSLARALVLNPEVLFLDEPFSSLDFETRTDLLEKLSGFIKEKGITTFFVTHDYSEIPFWGGDVMALDQGRIVRREKVENIFTGNTVDSIKRLWKTDAF